MQCTSVQIDFYLYRLPTKVDIVVFYINKRQSYTGFPLPVKACFYWLFPTCPRSPHHLDPAAPHSLGWGGRSSLTVSTDLPLQPAYDYGSGACFSHLPLPRPISGFYHAAPLGSGPSSCQAPPFLHLLRRVLECCLFVLVLSFHLPQIAIPESRIQDSGFPPSSLILIPFLLYLLSLIQGSQVTRFKRLKQTIRDGINGGDEDGTFFQILGFESRFLDLNPDFRIQILVRTTTRQN